MSSAYAANPRVTQTSPAENDTSRRGNDERTGRPRTKPRTEVAARLRTAMLRELSIHERLLVLLWYTERLTPAEIGLVLDLTAEQVGRVHDSILARLNASLAAA